MSEPERPDDFLTHWAGEYNRPPDTPREEIWEGVRDALWPAEVGGEEVLPFRRPERNGGGRRSRRAWWLAAVGAAAVLVVGFGLGRWSASDGVGSTSTFVSPRAPEATTGFRTAALSHFSETESFLTLVRGDAEAGRVDAEVGRWAEGLLAQTRLLLDSPAAEDPAVRGLLEDLELVLVQVVGVEADGEAGTRRAREELRILAEGMDDQDVLPRIRAMVPEPSVVRGL